jgi:transcriptional regulator with XRE-family HTH domain
MGYDYGKFEILCENKGVKPSTVSRITGVSTATLSSWKGGKYTPKSDKIRSIANYFGVSIAYFEDDKGEEDDSVGLPGYFKQYIFEEDIASYALKLKREPVLKEILDAVEPLNDSNRRIILFLAGKLKEEQGK